MEIDRGFLIDVRDRRRRDTLAGKRLFTKEQVEELSRSVYVRRVDETTVSFTDEFKELFIHEYFDDGKKPGDIFRGAGIDTSILGYKRVERCSYHWRKDYEAGMLKKEDKAKAHIVEELAAARETMAQLSEENRVLKERLSAYEGR